MNTKTASKSRNINVSKKRVLQEVDKLKKQFSAIVALLNGTITVAEPKPSSRKKAPKTRSHSDRPTVREVVRAYVRTNGPTSANDLFYMAKEKHGGWSRHSLYRVLHDKREFHLADGKYALVGEGTSKKSAAAA